MEIGVQRRQQNFDKINVSETSGKKIGIDPDPASGATFLITSDAFFAKGGPGFGVDVCFIDGLHHADQVKRDFENSMRCLNDGGFIVIHDTLPENEAGTIVPRQQRQWWGDVYKWAMTLDSYDGIQHATLDMDNGCTIVWKDSSVEGVPCIFGNEGVTWQKYIDWKDRYYNFVKPSYIEAVLPAQEAAV